MITEILWQQLEASHVDEYGIVRRRVHSDSTFDVYAAVSQPDSQRLVTVVVAGNLKVPELPETVSIGVTTSPRTDDRIEVRVRLLRREMAPVFSPFAADLLGAMSAAADGQQALNALADRFEHWRNLLTAGPNGLSTSAMLGLFGELWTLQNLCSPTVGTDEAVAAWEGPDHNRRDIVIGGLGLEVKTTLAVPPASVQISSELQLDAAPLDHLVLVALEVDESVGTDGLSVPELVDSLATALGEKASTLEGKLVKYGYHAVHVPKYERRRFILRRLGLYEVLAGFPRITAASLHPGVGEVRYRLNLGACEPWAIDAAVLSQRMTDATRSRA